MKERMKSIEERDLVKIKSTIPIDHAEGHAARFITQCSTLGGREESKVQIILERKKEWSYLKLIGRRP
jgi:hypothetical protein